MILVGQYDSPFVRRVAVTMQLYGLPFSRDKTSVFSERMTRVHPLVRIPSLVLDDGEVLWDSAAILDYLDERIGPEKAVTPRSGAARREVLRATTLATGTTEKAGAVVYERHFHKKEHVASQWVDRCLAQLAGGLSYLDAHLRGPWFFGDRITQADVTLGCLMDFLNARLVEALAPGRYPALERLARSCEALPAFRETRPAPDELMPGEGSAWSNLAGARS